MLSRPAAWDPFWVNCYVPHGGEQISPFEGVSESPSGVKADWNCRLQMSAFSFAPVLRIPFSLSDVIPNASI